MSDLTVTAKTLQKLFKETPEAVLPAVEVLAGEKCEGLVDEMIQVIVLEAMNLEDFKSSEVRLRILSRVDELRKSSLKDEVREDAFDLAAGWVKNYYWGSEKCAAAAIDAIRQGVLK